MPPDAHRRLQNPEEPPELNPPPPTDSTGERRFQSGAVLKGNLGETKEPPRRRDENIGPLRPLGHLSNTVRRIDGLAYLREHWNDMVWSRQKHAGACADGGVWVDKVRASCPTASTVSGG
jgi:hypothetical protein